MTRRTVGHRDLLSLCVNSLEHTHTISVSGHPQKEDIEIVVRQSLLQGDVCLATYNCSKSMLPLAGTVGIAWKLNNNMRLESETKII